MSPFVRRAFRLVLGGLAASCVLAEIGLRVFAPQVFPSLPEGLVSERPDGAKTLTPGFATEFRRSEFRTALHISDFGVRGQAPGPRRPDSHRILVLGGADTFGLGVEDDHTYSARLQELLSLRYPTLHIEVVNAGVPGHGTIDELMWLQERGRLVDADLVLLQFSSYSDFEINGDSPLTRAVLEESRTADAPSVPSSAPSVSSRLRAWVHRLKRHSHLVALAADSSSYVAMNLALFSQQWSLWGEEFTAEEAERTERILGRLRATASELHVPLVLVYTTGKAIVIGPEAVTLPSEAIVAAAARREGIAFIDMTAELRRHADRRRLYFWRDSHWTAAGHDAVAAILAERLTGLGLVRPRVP